MLTCLCNLDQPNTYHIYSKFGLIGIYNFKICSEIHFSSMVAYYVLWHIETTSSVNYKQHRNECDFQHDRRLKEIKLALVKIDRRQNGYLDINTSKMFPQFSNFCP